MSNYLSLLEKYPDLLLNKNALIKIVLDEETISSWQAERRQYLLNNNLPEDWSQLGIVFDDPYIMVVRDLVKFPNKKLGSYLRIINRADLEGGQSVVVFPEMNGKYLLLHQYRHPTRSWSYEVPRGFGEPGIKAEEQAANEIREEVHGKIEKLIDLGIYHCNTGLEAGKVKLFYAKLKSVGEPAIEEGIKSIHWASCAELEQMIAHAEITDGFTIAAYTRAKLRGLLD